MKTNSETTAIDIAVSRSARVARAAAKEAVS
jgi:hypothetical protein